MRRDERNCFFSHSVQASTDRDAVLHPASPPAPCAERLPNCRRGPFHPRTSQNPIGMAHQGLGLPSARKPVAQVQFLFAGCNGTPDAGLDGCRGLAGAARFCGPPRRTASPSARIAARRGSPGALTSSSSARQPPRGLASALTLANPGVALRASRCRNLCGRVPCGGRPGLIAAPLSPGHCSAPSVLPAPSAPPARPRPQREGFSEPYTGRWPAGLPRPVARQSEWRHRWRDGPPLSGWADVPILTPCDYRPASLAALEVVNLPPGLPAIVAWSKFGQGPIPRVERAHESGFRAGLLRLSNARESRID